MNSSSTSRWYGLRLGNGQQWQIIGANGMARAAEELASVMQLQAYEGEGARRLILKSRDASYPEDASPVCDLRGDIPANLLGGDWEAYSWKQHRVFLHDETQDVIFEVNGPVVWRDDMTADERRECTSKEWLLLREIVSIIYWHAQDVGGLPIHGAFAAWKGLGVLLLGHSGAGKSTCCRRLPASWQALSDDEALVVRNDRGEYLVHPFPTWSNFGIPKTSLRQWHRMSWRVEQCVPLAAIFILEQAETDEIIPVWEGEAALLLAGSATQVWLRSPPRRPVVDNGCEIARSVPAFVLRVSLTGRFWEEIERTLSQPPMAGNGNKTASS